MYSAFLLASVYFMAAHASTTGNTSGNTSSNTTTATNNSTTSGSTGAVGPGMTTDLSLPATKNTGKCTFYTFWNSAAVSCNPMKCPDDGFCAAIPLKFMQPKGSSKESCGKCVKIVYEKKKAAVARVMDTCPECPEGNLDISDKLFEKLIGDLGKGRVDVEWGFVDCDSGAAVSGDSSGSGSGSGSGNTSTCTSTATVNTSTCTSTSTSSAANTTSQVSIPPSATSVVITVTASTTASATVSVTPTPPPPANAVGNLTLNLILPR